MVLFPLKALGEEGWKIAAALTARHIGGAVNYMVSGTQAASHKPAYLACWCGVLGLVAYCSWCTRTAHSLCPETPTALASCYHYGVYHAACYQVSL
jgi:hypothetical protein